MHLFLRRLRSIKPTPERCVGVWPTRDRWVLAQVARHADGELHLERQEEVVLTHPVDLTLAEDSAPDEPRAWQEAIGAVRRAVANDIKRLVFAWPDAGLWHSAIMVPGPLSATHIGHHAELEIAQRLPWPLDRSAWDYRLPVVLEDMRLQRQRQSWWNWRAVPEASQNDQPLWEGDVSVQCWSLPLSRVRGLDACLYQQGFHLSCLEPASISIERCQGQRPDAAGTASERDLAFAVASRAWAEGPNLVPRRGWFHARWRRLDGRRVALGMLGAAFAAWVGWQAGQRQAIPLRHEQADWAQRAHALQMQGRERQAQEAEQQRLQAIQVQQQAREAHNLRFAQAMQGLAATLPPGLLWQRVNLRPRQIELHGLAGDAGVLSHWLDRWPASLAPGGRHHLQWQPSTWMAEGLTWPVFGLEIQLAWADKEVRR